MDWAHQACTWLLWSSLQRVLAGWDVNIATPLRWIMEIPRVQRAACSGGGGSVQRAVCSVRNPERALNSPCQLDDRKVQTLEARRRVTLGHHAKGPTTPCLTTDSVQVPPWPFEKRPFVHAECSPLQTAPPPSQGSTFPPSISDRGRARKFNRPCLSLPKLICRITVVNPTFHCC